MSCCAPGAETGVLASPAAMSAAELRLASRPVADGVMQTDLSVPDVHCGACIHAIEKALGRLDGVQRARVNLSSRRVCVRWLGSIPPPLVETLADLGYAAHPFEAPQDGEQARSLLLRAVAVSGFAAANIMLLSVSVWSGATEATRDLFHWLSALIAIPALVLSGGVFYRSAWNGLRHGRMNMDVPIAIGVTLSYAMSLYETIVHGEHAYFDAAVSLLFFLLVGRTLDHMMRERARAAVTGLARLAPRGAMVVRDDGSRDYLPAGEIEPGMRVLVAAGERIVVDGRVLEGESEFDCAIVTGESTSSPARAGTVVRAGALNLARPLTVEATATAANSFIAEMVAMMEVAEGGRARYRRIADRASALYAPVVHLAAALTFLGWLAVGGDWHRAATIAIAVLIITCPCALGLAVPIVQVVAARRLFEKGIMVRDGSAMERLAEVDTVVFDKTGTLTTGTARLRNRAAIDPPSMVVAASLAAHSRHPFSRAIAAAGRDASFRFDRVEEIAGCGVEATAAGAVWRLGRGAWASPGPGGDAAGAGTVLSKDGTAVAVFRFQDGLRPGAARAVAALRCSGLDVEILSGDRPGAVAEVAGLLAIDDFHASLLPGEKTLRLSELAARGSRALMVGDGLNDAPALVAAHVSMAPATAADVGRNAADFVFLRDDLTAVPFAISIARRARRLVHQNFALAIGYNALVVPIAVLGYVTPLVAACAMSASSLLVIANAMRLTIGEVDRPPKAPGPAGGAPAAQPVAAK